MPQDKDAAELRSSMLLALIAGSLILFAGSIYVLKDFSILYGVGVGATLQSVADNAILNQTIRPIAANLSFFHIGIAISYLLTVSGLILCSAALIIFLRKDDNPTRTMRTYGLLHSAFTILYLLVLLLLLSYFYQYVRAFYLYIVYFGIAVCAISNAYIQYDIRTLSKNQKIRSSINLDPSTPFSNMVNLQDELFSKMAGHLKVVDKHFNTSSLVNFHRLIDKNAGNFQKITILTSQEMLDGDFSNGVSDMVKELGPKGVQLEVRIMDEKDSAEQHERFVADDSVAYKVPPFNIINKKSEHISRIKLSDVNSRFNYLYGRASKIENYLVRKGHDEQKQK